MNDLSEFLIALVDLLEAEGRALRRAVARLSGFLVLLTLAGFFALGGILLCFVGLYRYLVPIVGAPQATVDTGVSMLLAALLIAWVAGRILR